MKCPTCGSQTRVLETRKRAPTAIYRRYVCAAAHRFSTIESVFVPTAKEPATSEPPQSYPLGPPQ